MAWGDAVLDDEAFAQVLVTTGALTPQQLESARAARDSSPRTLDEVLVDLGMASEIAVRHAMAEAWQVPAFDPERVVRDPEVLREYADRRYLRDGWMPLCREDDGTILVATACAPTPALIYRLESELEGRVRPIAASRSDLRHLALLMFSDEIADEAADGLYRRNPLLSARHVLWRSQRIGLVLICAVLLAGLVFWTAPTVTTLLTVFAALFLVGTGFKFFVSLKGARFDILERVPLRAVAALTDAELPVYTVLVPVFREENIVGRLVENLGRIDYPTHKLEVLVLIEEEDTLTREAFDRADPPPNFRVITIPAGSPQTKPRACNVGLFFASGEYLVIFDAEDTPDPDQLKKAFVAFRRGGPRTVCIQAALSYFNSRENVLTRMFSLEYSYWFDYMLAGLDAWNLPIPLGGTSNHFRTRALIELGGWDPYNVTEDADLGVRASALGYRVGVIDSTTLEEANTSVPNFIRQRSRWIKGYMQTSLVHARQPFRLLMRIGARRTLAFALLIAGTPAIFLAMLPLCVLAVVSVALPAAWLAEVFPPWLLWLTLVNFVVGNAMMVYLSMMGPYKRGAFALIGWALLNPLYWILHSVAAYKALWQLITKPHYWEKTAHGLSREDVAEHLATEGGVSL
ncbi:glycosyltransferase [Homoserinibacter sp. GY 40078]|uniref:glycosyltransferase n=1 Tax=Homoserinibacter sp. GY 40078 TaxID=2603275 RepID=UPI0011CB3DC0|nr:glycosyltransferase [Homoserinibacter sp. GY 40078]TXK17512.1 glycosyltransferase [Homoserinibacter sp. GY 40078]